MPVKPVVPRAQACADADQAIEFYLDENAPDAALGFADALEAAYDQVGRHRAVGSPRYDHELNLPGLRILPLHGFPYIVFYIEREHHVDVWRVLHGQRDIPSSLRE